MIRSKSIRTIAASMFFAATLAVVSMPAAHASIFHHDNANQTASTKPVHFSVRNQTAADIELKAGDQTMVVPKGKTIELNLAAGTRITNNTATDKTPAGSVVCEVSAMLANNTVVLN